MPVYIQDATSLAASDNSDDIVQSPGRAGGAGLGPDLRRPFTAWRWTPSSGWSGPLTMSTVTNFLSFFAALPGLMCTPEKTRDQFEFPIGGLVVKFPFSPYPPQRAMMAKVMWLGFNLIYRDLTCLDHVHFQRYSLEEVLYSAMYMSCFPVKFMVVDCPCSRVCL